MAVRVNRALQKRKNGVTIDRRESKQLSAFVEFPIASKVEQVKDTTFLNKQEILAKCINMHLKASGFEKILSECNSKYVIRNKSKAKFRGGPVCLYRETLFLSGCAPFMPLFDGFAAHDCSKPDPGSARQAMNVVEFGYKKRCMSRWTFWPHLHLRKP